MIDRDRSVWPCDERIVDPELRVEPREFLKSPEFRSCEAHTTHTREYDKSDGSDGGEGETSHDSGGEDWWAVVMASVMHSRVRRLKE